MKARNSPRGDGSVSKMTRESPGMALGSGSREVQHEDPTADGHIRRLIHLLEAMKRNPQPQFLKIRWEDLTKEGTVTLETVACLRHRQEIALAHASARGAGGRGDACDLCEGHHPRQVGSEPSQSAPPSARVP